MKCSACGSMSLVQGSIRHAGDGANTTFRPGDASLWQRVFGTGTRKVNAFACTHCGGLQLAVVFEDDDLRRYQQFEGEQPDLLERLNDEPEKPQA